MWKAWVTKNLVICKYTPCNKKNELQIFLSSKPEMMQASSCRRNSNIPVRPWLSSAFHSTQIFIPDTS